MEFVLLFLTCLAGSVFSACPPGLCSLDEMSFFLNENCDIKADTECDINVNCNGDGKCFFDQYTKNITCICSEKRIGDMCQYNYITLGMPCSSNLDCHSGVCIVAGPVDNRTNDCDCHFGSKGARCEIIDRKYLSESWECENEARAYIQGQYLGCSCKCGTIGQFCEEMDKRAPYYFSCDSRLCKRGGGNAIRINGAHNGYQPETRSTPTHTSDAQTRQSIEQLNANNNMNTSQNSTHTESNNDPPSYEEVCQPPPTYSDVLRSMP
ncbi:neurogenic locus Notch protein-like isoform X2 [Mya arenaria]|uniref:neurogenic locus Notch protein-like isoform X2 n=1 Tax=Mya arenaria TaxID=6604 RepID=UPI0022E90723|nr:neurogenic locus Notch protein-like isoform X2 [Mya arenaria]